VLDGRRDIIELRFLFAAPDISGATIYGTLELVNAQDVYRRGMPLGGVKIRVSSRGLVSDITTSADGTFIVVSAIFAALIVSEPVLTFDLSPSRSDPARWQRWTLPETVARKEYRLKLVD